MKAGRWAGVMLLLMVPAVAVVHLRAEQARCAARMLKSEAARIALRGELWELQTSVGRLRSPGEIHERLRRLRELAAASAARPAPGAEERVLTLTHR